MFYDLLVHVDLPDESRFVMALGNINNYLAALNGEPCTVVLLANGGAASFLARKDNAQTEAIEKLAQAGVSFRVCANAMKKVPIIIILLRHRHNIIEACLRERYKCFGEILADNNRNL